MAQQMSDARDNDTYLAGLWKRILVLNLAWIALRPTDELTTDPARPCHLLSNWTWAHLDEQEVHWGFHNDTEPLSNVQNLETECQTEGSPFMSALRVPTVVFRAGLIPLATALQCLMPLDYSTELRKAHRVIYRETAADQYEGVATSVRGDQVVKTNPRSYAEVFVLLLTKEPRHHQNQPASLATVRASFLGWVEYRHTTEDKSNIRGMNRSPTRGWKLRSSRWQGNGPPVVATEKIRATSGLMLCLQIGVLPGLRC